MGTRGFEEKWERVEEDCEGENGRKRGSRGNYGMGLGCVEVGRWDVWYWRNGSKGNESDR